MLSMDNEEMMKNESHQVKEKKTAKWVIRALHPISGQLGLPQKLTGDSLSCGKIPAILYMYIGVSCPVRSLNMAAGMVFMWIWRWKTKKKKHSLNKMDTHLCGL